MVVGLIYRLGDISVSGHDIYMKIDYYTNIFLYRKMDNKNGSDNEDNTEEKRVAFRIRWETPRDLEAEDYLYQYNKIYSQLKGISPDVQMLGCMRMCDGCHNKISFMQKALDFKCCDCGTRFDLCQTCQSTLDKSKCPVGWGCGIK